MMTTRSLMQMLYMYVLLFVSMHIDAQDLTTIPSRGIGCDGVGVFLDNRYNAGNKMWYMRAMDGTHGEHVVYAADYGDKTVLGEACVDIAFMSDEDIASAYAWKHLGSYAYRQVDDQVYYYDEGREQFVLLFDFGLRTGDEAVIEGIPVRVDAVCTCVELLGECTVWPFLLEARVLMVSECDHPEKQDVWVEGIGSLYTGLAPTPIKATKDLQLLYTMDKDQINSIAINTATYKERRGTPFYKGDEEIQGYLILEDDEFPNYIHCNFCEDTLHVTVITHPQNGRGIYFICKTDGSDVWIAMDEYGFGSQPGNTSRFMADFFGFAQGSYNVHVKNPRAGAYEDVGTLVCQGKIPTSVEEVSNPAATTEPFCDLAGRRLAREPEHGLYIRDGRKYLKR